MKVVCLSDTHEMHREVPPIRQRGDLLIHAGDFTFFCEKLSIIRDFNAWLGELPFRYRIVVPGNHEHIMYTRPEIHSLITNATLLINEAVTIEGVRLWGSPVTCDDDAFGCATAEERRRLYATIPVDTDIVITHGPAFGILDEERHSRGVHLGCPELRTAIERVKPKFHVFGHVHSGHGAARVGDTIFANVAMIGCGGDLDKKPMKFEITPSNKAK